VTGDHERYRVCGAGSRDGSSRTWVADAGGHLPVQLHFTVRNGLEIVPDSNLEDRGANVKGEV